MATADQFNPNQCTQSAVIANGATVSGVVTLAGTTLVGLVFPAGLVTNTCRFQVSADGNTYVELDDQYGTRYSVPAVASTAVSLDPAIMAGWPFVKLDMASAVTAERTMTALSRPV